MSHGGACTAGGCFSSSGFHQIMCDRLGDRDYDSFEADQLQQLRDKIGFAFFGPPQNDSGDYEERQKEQVEAIFQQIRDVSSKSLFS